MALTTKKKAAGVAAAVRKHSRERARKRDEHALVTTPGVDAEKALVAAVGRLTLGKLIRSIREGEEESLAKFGEKLDLTPQKLSDIERGRRNVSPERAAGWARKLGYSEAQFVRLALEQELQSVGLKFDVQLTPQA